MKKSLLDTRIALSEIPIDKIALKFRDPDTNDEIIVPVTQIIVGGLDYTFVNAHPYVYQKEKGYLAIQTNDSVMLQRLDPSQIEIIEWVLSEKQRLEYQKQISDEFDSSSFKIRK